MTNLNQRLLVHNACLFTPTHTGLPGWLLVENGLIKSIGFGNTPDFSNDPSIQSLDAQGHNL